MKNHISTHREESGLSQAELAEELGVTRQTINAIERDRYDPSLTLALQLGEFFGIPVEDLFDYTTDTTESHQ